MPKPTNALTSVTLVCIALVGCSTSEFEVAPAAGKVTIDGQPFTTGKVMFAPVASHGEINAGRAAIARLESDGTFQLGTYDDDDGAVVGEHWVTIINTEELSATSERRRLPMFGRFTVPSGTFQVVAGERNQFDIDISSDEIRRYGRPG